MAYSREVMNFQGERVQALGQQDAFLAERVQDNVLYLVIRMHPITLA